MKAYWDCAMREYVERVLWEGRLRRRDESVFRESVM